MKSRVATTVAITAFVLAFSGLTAAQSASIVKLCLYPVKGTVRQITGSKCARGEKLLTLGVQGPRGPEGPSGIPGEAGPVGPRGLKGDTGATGPAGTAGAAGLRGLKGDKGDPGNNGLQGAPGATGPSLVVKDANGAFVGYLIDVLYAYASGKVSTYVVWSTTAQRIISFTPNAKVWTLDLADVGAMFTTNDCSGSFFAPKSSADGLGASAGDLVSLNTLSGTVVWYQITDYTLADGESTALGSTPSGQSCSTDVPPAIVGPFTAGSWLSFTVADSPIPTYVGPLTIAVQ